MTTDLRCDKHQFEEAAGVCKSCCGAYCPECLVYTEGIKKSPLCIPCALTAAGVRSNAANPVRARRPKGRFFGRAAATIAMTATTALLLVSLPASGKSH